jgi:hypothetical protein
MDFIALPTKYKNVQFRSRLEARWAAFFDLIKWRWEYEPFDLRGWIPDFLIEKTVLVEVKPIVFTKDPCQQIEVLDGDLAKCRNILATKYDLLWETKIFGMEGLVLGTGPLTVDCGCYSSGGDGNTVAIGLFYSRAFHPDGVEHFEFDDAILKVSNTHRRIDLGGNWLAWSGRFFDDHNKMESVSFGQVERLWRQAGNAVQWRKPAQ